MSTGRYALSVKQPWAALLVAGQKTVEVRTWPTARRGSFLIHAAKVSDPRPEAWKWVTDDPILRPAAGVVGGIVGAAEVVEVIEYRTAENFAADADRHLVPPEWYRGRLYGFVVAKAVSVPFRAWPGNTSFFEVTAADIGVILCDPPEGPATASSHPRGPNSGSGL